MTCDRQSNHDASIWLQPCEQKIVVAGLKAHHPFKSGKSKLGGLGQMEHKIAKYRIYFPMPNRGIHERT